MHRLVHLASAWWLEDSNRQSGWISKAAARLEELIPYGGHEGREVWTRYLSHGMYVSRPDGKLDEIRRASLLDRVGRCQKSVGLYGGAEAAHWQALDIRKRAVGMEHPHTLTSMSHLASTYRNQGRWKEAEELEMQVMETRKRVLGVEHPSTLASMANLASTYWNQGRWKEAEELQVQVMETSKKVLGAEHPSTLTSMNNLALTWRDRGKEEEAVDLMRECVQLQVRILRPAHPHTLSSSRTLSGWESEEGS